LRHRSQREHFSYADIMEDSRVVQAAFEYAPLLPSDKSAPVLDVGFGQGWFLAACLKLGYKNLSGADFAIKNMCDHGAAIPSHCMKLNRTLAVSWPRAPNNTHSFICRT